MSNFFNKSPLAACLFALLTGCVQQTIDFENDVPQRARSISQQHVKKARDAMEIPVLRAQYREYMNNKGKGNGNGNGNGNGVSNKTLSRLQQEKKALENKIAVIVRSQSGNVCPICRKKFNVRTSKKSAVVKKTKSGLGRKTPVSAAPKIQQVVAAVPQNDQLYNVVAQQPGNYYAEGQVMPQNDYSMMQNPAVQNPVMQNQAIQNPAMQNPAMQNPGMPMPGMQNPAMQNQGMNPAGQMQMPMQPQMPMTPF